MMIEMQLFKTLDAGAAINRHPSASEEDYCYRCEGEVEVEVCGCYYCEECRIASQCYDCHRLDRAGL